MRKSQTHKKEQNDRQTEGETETCRHVDRWRDRRTNSGKDRQKQRSGELEYFCFYYPVRL